MTITDAPGEIYWDPFDTEIDANPYPVWRRLRDEQPLYRNDRYDFWALSRYEDVEAAHRDPDTFSSGHGTVLEIMGPEHQEHGSIIFKDPPEHTKLRSLVSRAFTPRRMAAMEDTIRSVCAELLDPYVGTSGFDYVQDFAVQLPSRVISRLVGVPEDEREEQRVNIDNSLHIEPGVGMINDISLTARINLYEYLAGLVARRRQDPADDLLSVIGQAEITDEHGEERRLTDDEVTDFTGLLFSAGTETVMRLLGNSAVLLTEHPDQRAELAADAGPEVFANAVEELLRFEAPSPVQGRWTTREVSLHGVTIPEGSKVLLLTASANRDDRVYSDPDRLDVRREVRPPHVSFGYGIHFCIGAALARLEGRVALEETLRRWPTWDLDRERVARAYTSTVRGYEHVGMVLPS